MLAVQVEVPVDNRFVMVGEPWSAYTRWLKLFDERRHVRITYDRGALEIMTFTHEHEHRAVLLARLINAWTEERGLPIKGGKSTTFRRREIKRGLEPDECFWIANESLVRNKERIDLREDPPPDLAIEIDVTNSCIPRLPIYAALKFPEVWRIDQGVLSFQVLQPDGAYAPALVSRSLPPLTPEDVEAFLALRGQMDENTLVRRFRDWVGQLPPPTP
jgi:Uma2 family endonuclease